MAGSYRKECGLLKNHYADEYEELLKTWADRLLELQVHDTGNKRLDGGILCPACMTIHGRCTDFIYPLLYLEDRYGGGSYQKAALRLFDWGENLLCDDGSMYNDAQSPWNGITVFSVISLCEALENHGHLLKEADRKRFEERLDRMGGWIYQNLTMEFVTNINYHAATAAAMALLGSYRGREDYKARARQMAKACLSHITEDGFLYGEGKPMEHVTKRGCRPVDIGYNVEESIPELLMYARVMEDEEALRKVRGLLKTHLDFMLPDGGWDNSFGTRNFKWTYWGSRTSDGCQEGYGMWGQEEPQFSEAAYRNLLLYKACTPEGFLYGGPDYHSHGETPCIHHAFSHAKSLTSVLDHGVEPWERCSLPAEEKQGMAYYPTIDTWRIYKGPWIGTVTAYDFEYLKGGHTSGGTLSMLWHRKMGPVIASSMTEYSLFEAHNMQQSVRKAEHRPLTPRIEMTVGKTVYATCFDTDGVMDADQGTWTVKTDASLVSAGHERMQQSRCSIQWKFEDERILITGRVPDCLKDQAEFVLPLIGQRVFLQCEAEYKAECKAEDIFFLAGGFKAREYRLRPDRDGRFAISIVCGC